MDIFIATIGMIIGIIGGLYFHGSIVFFLLFLFYMLYLKKRKRKKESKLGIYVKILWDKKMLLCLLIGFIYGFVNSICEEQSYTYIYKHMPKEVSGIGIIVSEKQDKEYKVVYHIKIEKIRELQEARGKEYLLEIKKGKNIEIPTLSYGDKISFTATYEKPSGQRNFGGFDYSFYLKTKQLHGTLSCTNTQVQIKDKKKELQNTIYEIANQIKNNSQKILSQENARFTNGYINRRYRFCRKRNTRKFQRQ